MDNPFQTGGSDPVPTGTEMPSGFVVTPFRRDFDAARDPYTARNALGFNAPVAIKGVTDSASLISGAITGYVGELLSAAQPTPQTLTTATALSLASLSLGAGDYNIWGIIGYTGNVATTVNYIVADLSTTANTLTNSIDHTASTVFAGATAFNFLANIWLPTPVFPVSVASTTAYKINAQSGFGVSTCQATGKIWARRMR